MGIARRINNKKPLAEMEEDKALINVNEEDFIWVQWASEEEVNDFIENYYSMSAEQLDEFLDSIPDEQEEEIMSKIDEQTEENFKCFNATAKKMRQGLDEDRRWLEENCDANFSEFEKLIKESIKEFQEHSKEWGVNMDEDIRFCEEKLADLVHLRRIAAGEGDPEENAALLLHLERSNRLYESDTLTVTSLHTS